MSWPTALGILALGWSPLAVTVARGGTELGAAVIFAAVVAPGVLAVAVDDEADELTGAAPVPLAQRRVLRLALLGLAFLGVLAVALVVAAGRDGGVAVSLDERAPEAAAVGAVALAWASLLPRRPGAAGPSGATAGSLSVGLVALLAQRFPWLPAIGGAQHHGWWWWVAAAGAATVAWSWRDPAGRRPLRSRG
jgi:hypothetical protein